MTSKANAGQRCRATSRVTSVSGTVEAQSEGRIRYVVENLGRLLVAVDWDGGGSSMLFAHELDLTESPS